ncbi:hypothetical protein ACFL47_07105, partial [Candidatus Latescibacterota bacterium]
QPILDAGNSSYLVHHTIAHPLVLSVSIPENDLSKREGIYWDDSASVPLAMSIDPSANYLGTNFNKALLTYYMKLWIYYPDEMLNIYKNKLLLTGHYITAKVYNSDFKTQLSDSSILILRMILFPFYILPNGMFYLLLFTVIFMSGFKLQCYVNSGFAYAMTSLATSGILLFIESMIIMPVFVLTYHSFLLFWIFFCCFLFYQIIINVLFSAVNHFLTKLGSLSWESDVHH